jgi:uncharacterized membrane protein YfcA
MEGAVNLPAAAIMAAGASLTAGFGAKFTGRLNGPKLQQILGVFMMVMAPMVPLKPYIMQAASEAKEGETVTDSAPPSMMDMSTMTAIDVGAYTFIGCITGFVSGLFGIGGGSIMTPALAVLTPLSQHAVIGTSLASMVLPSLVGAYTHHQLGNIVTRAVGPIIVGTAGGAFLGGNLGLSMPESELRWFFCALMLVLGGRQYAGATKKLAEAAAKKATEAATKRSVAKKG